MAPTDTPVSPRYAIYYAPQGGELFELGRFWLARDVLSGENLPPPALPGLSPDLHADIVRAPHRYGFHGTLKPPFHLAAAFGEGSLVLALEAFAAARRAFQMPPLKVTIVNDFVALTPSRPCRELDALGRACVVEFERFRAPMTVRERARRLDANLTPRHEELVAEFGYPYVLDQFRFHLTLTGSLDPEALARWQRQLRELWALALGRPVPVEGVALFRSPDLNGAFRQIGFFPFGS
jgi:hypothetical protein